jgi:hypothetical protein
LLARHIAPLRLHVVTQEIGLGGVIRMADELLGGRVRGRVVVDVRN